MKLTAPVVTEIAEDTWLVNEFGQRSLFVLRGSERSVVLEAGTGEYDLKPLLAELTGNRYEVLVSHAHPGNRRMLNQFPRIHLHEEDWPSLLAERPAAPLELGEIWEKPDPSKLPPHCNTEIRPLWDGEVFDLGNRRVVCRHIPIHTPGHMYFVDDMTRIAFLGDALSGRRYTGCTPEMRAGQLEKLLGGWGTLFTRCFDAHTCMGNSLTVRSIPVETLRTLLTEAQKEL